MIARPSKRNSLKRRLTFPSLAFRLVLLSIMYVYLFAPSQIRVGPNVSESATSGAVNDIQKRSNQDHDAFIADDKIFSNAKVKNQMKNNTKLNASLNAAEESQVNYFEKVEKPKAIFLEAKEKKPAQDIRGENKRVLNDLILNGIFQATLRSGFQNTNEKKNIDHLLSKKNTIFAYFSQEKKWFIKYLSDMCSQGKQRKWARNALRDLGFEKAARNCKVSKLKQNSPWKEDKNDQDENSAIDTILFYVCVLIMFMILTLNVLYLFLQVFKTGDSIFKFQNPTLYNTKWSRTLLMVLGLLLSHAPVGSDVTVSTTQGTYFQNDAPGRYLQGYVNESSVVYDLIKCQMRCNRLHSICKSLNYIKNEDESNICEINYDAQHCSLPGEFIVKENSFYVETAPEIDDSRLCSTCGYKGVIKETKGKGFKCLCQGKFYGNRCQHKADDLNLSPTLHGKPNYLKQLRSWLPSNSTGWRHCYQATKDGWAAATFHSQCNYKGPTVTLVRVGKYVFGGYTDVSWTPLSKYERSDNAFVYSLKNKDDLPPFKAPLYQNHGYAIYSQSNYCPAFGLDHAFVIYDQADQNTHSFTKFGYTYRAPQGYTQGAANTDALLAGTKYFTPSEVEVFYLQ